MSGLIGDLRYALRTMRKAPAFTGTAVVTLALGIACTTAVFSIINAAVIQPLRYGDPERLVLLWKSRPEGGMTNAPPRVFLAWREQATNFEQMAAAVDDSFDLRGTPPVRLGAAAVTPNFFRTLQVQPQLGRTFTAREAELGERVVVLSHAVWAHHFASDPRIVGKSIGLNGDPWTVIGVMPASFSFIRNHDLWTPLFFRPGELVQYHSSVLVIGRLRAGVSLEQAGAQMQTIAAHTAQLYPDTEAGWTAARLVPLRNFLLGPGARIMMFALLGAVACVLLIACANIANLLLARGAGRRKEMAMRLALGATRRRIVRQLLSESLLLGAFGAAIGLAVTTIAVHYLAKLPLLQAPGAPDVQVDATVLAFVVGLMLASMLAFGLLPAWQISGAKPVAAMRAGNAGSLGGFRRTRVRSVMVVAEIALSVVLLAAAGVLIRSFLKVQQVNPGVDDNRLITADLSLSRQRYDDSNAVRHFYQQAIARVRALPGVESADISTTLPLLGWTTGLGLRLPTQPKDAALRQFASLQAVTETYFRTVGTPILQGRAFTADDTATSTPVAVINQRVADRFFRGANPVGERLLVRERDGSETPAVIVGVAADVKDQALDSPSSLDLYLPFEQHPIRWEYLVVRSRVDTATMVAGIRGAVAAVDKDQPIEDIATMEQRLNDSLSSRRFSATLLTLFAMIALLLAAIGAYGVISYGVAQRTPEFGVRIALGASPRVLLAAVMLGGLRLAAMGCAIGVAGALALTASLRSFVFGISPTDPAAFAAAVGLIALSATAAVFVPARRAARVDPIAALRWE